jgi:hypothetical protein
MRPLPAASSLVCSICTDPIAPHQPVAYLDTGAVVHPPCRISAHGAAGKTVAIVQPSAHAMQLRVREARVAASATRTMLRAPVAGVGHAPVAIDPARAF